jgi:hypothetical protein
MFRFCLSINPPRKTWNLKSSCTNMATAMVLPPRGGPFDRSSAAARAPAGYPGTVPDVAGLLLADHLAVFAKRSHFFDLGFEPNDLGFLALYSLATRHSLTGGRWRSASSFHIG